MKILVTGGTGNVGGSVVKELLKRGAEVRVLARKQPESKKLPAGVEVAIGDLLDPVLVEQAMQGVDKLFLLNAVVADELTQALIAYGMAKRVGLKQVTYLSVFKVEQFRDVPQFASKLAVESAMREFGVPHTIMLHNLQIRVAGGAYVKRACMAAENVTVAAGHSKMLAVVVLDPRERPWRVRQVRASVAEKLRAAWVG